MNRMLLEVETKYPGRFHFAILKLSDKLADKDPTNDQLELLNEPFYEMGVYPIWVHSFDEIANIIRNLN
jgi:hypothetical protein